MYGYHTLWRRKKMFCVILGCLGISVLISVMMVIGNANTTNGLLRSDDIHSADYYVNYGGVNQGSIDGDLRAVLRENNNVKVGLGKVQGYAVGKTLEGYHGNNGAEDYHQKVGHNREGGNAKNKPARLHLNKQEDDNDEYNDDGYYGDDLADRKVTNDNQNHPRVAKGNEGFVIEDNAAAYKNDYNEEEDDYEDYVDSDQEDDYVNPPFKVGDFDYKLNGTKPAFKLKFEETEQQNRTSNSQVGPVFNDTRKYGTVQYKSFHLLETHPSKVKTLVNSRSNNAGKLSKKLRTDETSLTKQQNQKLIGPNEVRNNLPQGDRPMKTKWKQPCMDGRNCANNFGNEKQQDSILQPKKVGLKERLRGASVQHNENNLDKHQNSQVKDREELQSNPHLPHQEVETYIPKREDNHQNGYQNVQYFTHQNNVVQDRIETQIPIQDGGVDANWLLQEQPATQIQMPELPWQPGEVRSPEGIPLVVDKIYWSKEVEDLISQGITNEKFQNFMHKLYSTPVKEMHPPQWNRCGRPSNQYIVLSDQTPLCARFREEHVKLLHGEVLSFYFSRILGLDNVPIVILSEASSAAPQWKGMNLTAAGWNESSIVALIQWIDGLESERSRVKMPSVILEAFEKGGVFDHHHRHIHGLEANNLTQLVQWSDLILFDYLTGHYDRVASMQDGADRENKPSIMHENIRNLRKVWQTGKMWLIDNESGLFDGYELLYHGGEMGRKFVQFHIQMLRTNCIFRRQTVQKILQLASVSSPHDALLQYAAAQEPLYQHLPYAKEIVLFKKYFHVRLKEVVSWIKKCQTR